MQRKERRGEKKSVSQSIEHDGRTGQVNQAEDGEDERE
jgi:hypothetical protein